MINAYGNSIPVFSPEFSHSAFTTMALNNNREEYPNDFKSRDLHRAAVCVKNEIANELKGISSVRYGSRISPEVIETVARKEYGIKNYDQSRVYELAFTLLDKAFRLGLNKEVNRTLKFESHDQETDFDRRITGIAFSKMLDALVIDCDSHIPAGKGRLIKLLQSCFNKFKSKRIARTALISNLDIAVSKRAKPLNLADEIYEEVSGVECNRKKIYGAINKDY